MSFELRQRLDRVARRIRSLRMWNGLAVCWLTWAAIGAALLVASTRWGWKLPANWPMFLAAMAAVTAWLVGYAIMRTARDQLAIARRVEAQHPELATLLLTAVEQVPQRGQPLGFLQSAVLRGAVEHGRLEKA